jgi:hypothetical protein
VDAVGDRPDGRDDVVLVDAEGSSAARRGAARRAQPMPARPPRFVDRSPGQFYGVCDDRR